MQNAPRGAFYNTFDLHLATICHEDLFLSFFEWPLKTGFTLFHPRLAHEAKSEDVRDEKTLLDLRRQYHCAAYNLMVAFISRTQSELKFYTSFLFEEKQSKVCKESNPLTLCFLMDFPLHNDTINMGMPV